MYDPFTQLDCINWCNSARPSTWKEKKFKWWSFQAGDPVKRLNLPISKVFDHFFEIVCFILSYKIPSKCRLQVSFIIAAKLTSDLLPVLYSTCYFTPKSKSLCHLSNFFIQALNNATTSWTLVFFHPNKTRNFSFSCCLSCKLIFSIMIYFLLPFIM